MTDRDQRLALVGALDIAYHAMPGPFVMASARLAAYIESVADERGPGAALDAIASARTYLDAAQAMCLDARRTEVLALVVKAQADADAVGAGDGARHMLRELAERIGRGLYDAGLDGWERKLRAGLLDDTVPELCAGAVS